MKIFILIILSTFCLSSYGVDFKKDILPILEKKCFECHSSQKKKPKGKLRVDSLEHILKGGKNSSFIVPGKPEKSLFYTSISLDKNADDVMPPTGKGEPVSKKNLVLVKKWIQDGANFGDWKKSEVREIAKKSKPIVSLAERFSGLKVPSSEKEAILKFEELLEKTRQKHKVSRNDSISDETFLRRIYISIAGRIPTLEESKKFLSSKDKNKRDRLIDDLLDSEAFVSNFYNYWADVFRIKLHLAASEEKEHIKLFSEWIKENIRKNKPYDVFVREMLSSTGNAFESPGVGYFFRDNQMPLDNMAYTTQVFLGTQLDCAMCHDHPFDQWSQHDFYKLGAFVHDARYHGYLPGWVTKEDVLNPPGRKRVARKVRDGKTIKNKYGRPVMELVEEKSNSLTASFRKSYTNKSIEDIRNNFRINNKMKIFGQNMKADVYFNNVPDELNKQASGQVSMAMKIVKILETNYFYRDYYASPLKLPDDYQYDDAKPKSAVKPGVPFGTQTKSTEARHIQYAKWLTSRDNPRFTRMISNRLLQYVFGMGLYAKHDDLKSSSVCSDPELMAYLEKLMLDRNFDMKAFLKVLYKSPTFQASVKSPSEKEMKTAQFPYHFQGPVLRRMSAEQVWDSIMTMMIPAVDHRKRYFRFRDREKFVNMRNMTGDEIVKFCIEFLKNENERLYKNRAKNFDKNYVTKAYKILYLTEPDARHKGHKQEWLRASELPQVLRSDRILRVFGRTDYQQIENSNRSSNVPQSLYLLNGIVDHELTSGNAYLWSQISKAKSVEEKLTNAFLGVLSRYPNSREKEKLQSMLKLENTEDLKDLFWALVNNEEFRFIY